MGWVDTYETVCTAGWKGNSTGYTIQGDPVETAVTLTNPSPAVRARENGHSHYRTDQR